MESFHLASCSASRSSRLLYTGFYTCAFAEGWALGAGRWAMLGWIPSQAHLDASLPSTASKFNQCLECLKAFLA